MIKYNIDEYLRNGGEIKRVVCSRCGGSGYVIDIVKGKNGLKINCVCNKILSPTKATTLSTVNEEAATVKVAPNPLLFGPL